MTSFIKDTLEDLKNKNTDFSKLIFILPSKRAGIVLKNELSKLLNKTFFAPTILSIEEFVEELSSLTLLSNIEILFNFYKVYLNNTEKNNQESFESFSKWANILLQDFNEIDRFLIDKKYIFSYLNEIQKIYLNHWSLNKNQTNFTKKYLQFWSKLNLFNNDLTNILIRSGKGYQGLIYREAVENIENYILTNNTKHHIFIGFNALNKAESIIIQELLQNQMASIYWDIDTQFIDSKIHNASHFINFYKKTWNYYKTNDFKWVSNTYNSKKNIQVIGVPQQIGQAKAIGELLYELKESSKLANTAVVLGDETLLIPVLNSLPKNVGAINITMGFPLKDTPLAPLFNRLFLMHSQEKSSFYYKDVISILSHQYIRPLFQSSQQNSADELILHLQQQNLVYVSESKLLSLTKKNHSIISLLFGNWKNNPETTISNCLSLIMSIKNCFSLKKEHHLALEYLYRFHEVFNVLFDLNSKYNTISTIKTFQGLFKELLSFETLDFKGEPLQGLQLMGMLESRVLDFETVIISSVNEGVLPSGKSNNSFIPFDVKLEVGLPTYQEKDAVYTYHFYRLIQRAKNVYIVYNTEVDALNGGEKSRFITQLEIEGIHKITHKLLTPKSRSINITLDHISKNDAILSKLKDLAKDGFSPSSLTSYIRNPLDFYYEKVLGIKQTDDVEEVVAANTLGSIIHNTLEDFYKPLEGEILTEDSIKKMFSKVGATVKNKFLELYKQGDITQGKNLIIFEIAKRYISNFLKSEIESLKKGNTIKIISIESNLNIPIEIEKLDFPIRLKGKVDRVDEFNGIKRIIDYKTGKVDQRNLEIVNWDDIKTDYKKYSKSFQVLMYAYMMNRRNPFNHDVEAGVFSFKNLNEGFLKFGKKESPYSRHKDTTINPEILKHFETELNKLILEIYNPNVDFIEKELD